MAENALVNQTTAPSPSPASDSSWWRAGGVAMAAMAACLLLRAALEPTLGDRADLSLLIPALLISAAIAGPLTVLSATALGLAGSVWLDGWGRFGSPASLMDLSLFIVIGLGAAYGAWRLRGAARKAALAHDRSEEHRVHLLSILDTVPDAMIVIDVAGVIQSFSATAEQMFGWPAADAIGRNISDMMPSSYRQDHDGHLARYLETGVRHIIGIGRVVVGERRDGSTFPMELSIGEMRSGSHRYFTGFVRDLTEPQAVKRRLQNMESEMIQVSRLSFMGQIASALAHELNQPLSAIANYMKGSVRLIDQDAPDLGMIRGALDQAGDQALRAGEIVRRLRDFVGRSEANTQVENLPKLIEETLALALVGTKASGPRLNLEFASEAQFVVADKVQVQQVILNLMRNAIDAMGDTPDRQLNISTTNSSGDMVQISISDTGSGISATVADQLFQPLISTKPNGMGVGLSICRTIVEAHGGHIWVEKRPKTGAVFCFTLRGAPAGAAVDAAPVSSLRH